MLSRPRHVWLAALVCGAFAFGVADRLLANVSELGLQASNLSSLWLVPAFLAGLLLASRRGAALAGMAAIMAVLAGYYGSMHFAEGEANTSYLIDVASPWFAGGLIAGPIFGILGREWRHGRPAAALPLVIAFILEGLIFEARFATGVRIGEAALGLLLAAGFVLAARSRPRAVLDDRLGAQSS